jgi:hypothetical protein
MKNISLFIFTFIGLHSYAQVTLPAGHCPRIGDTFVFAVDTSLYYPKPLTGGVYDFSNLKLNDSSYYYYIANDSLSTQPNANLKLKIDTNERTATYFKKTGSEAFVIALSSLPTQLPLPGAIPRLKGTLKFFSFPLSATTNTTTTDKIDITIPASFIPPQLNIDSILSNIPILPKGSTVVLDSFILTLNFDLNLKAIGTGKIKTPIDNNLDVLKLERKITVTPKILMNGKATVSGITLPISNFDVSSLLLGALPIRIPDITTHSYYSPTFRQEIINAAVDSNGYYRSVNYRFRTKNGATPAQISAVNNQEVDIQFIQNQIMVDGLQPSATYLMTILDLSGKKIQENTLSTRFNIVNWSPSYQPFILQIIGESMHWTRKFNLTHH